MKRALICLAFLPVWLSFHACDIMPIGGGTGGEGLTLSGVIVDPAGVPAANAKVRIYPEPDLAKRAVTSRAAVEGHSDSTSTDGAGRFRFTNLTAGRYGMTASFERNDTTYSVLVQNIEVVQSVDIGQNVALAGGTLLVRVRLYGFMPLQGARCSTPAASRLAVSDAQGLCRLNVPAGKHVVVATFGGTHPGYSDTLEVGPGDVNDDALIGMYSSDEPAPRVTASIRYFGRVEFEGVGEVGAAQLTIVTGGELPCDAEGVIWDEEGGINQVKLILIGFDTAFQGVGDLQTGPYEGLPAVRGEDDFADLGHHVDLNIRSLTGTEVAGHYEVLASNDQVVQEKLPFHAALCPD